MIILSVNTIMKDRTCVHIWFCTVLISEAQLKVGKAITSSTSNLLLLILSD